MRRRQVRHLPGGHPKNVPVAQCKALPLISPSIPVYTHRADPRAILTRCWALAGPG